MRRFLVALGCVGLVATSALAYHQPQFGYGQILEVGPAIIRATFSLFTRETNGIDRLSRNLTINGQTVAPTFRYEGANADATDWNAVVGETLTAAGSGGVFNLETPFVSDDKAVGAEATRYWEASGNTFADITTEDFVLEAVFKTDSDVATIQGIFGKWDASSGYLLFIASGKIWNQTRGSGVHSESTATVVGNTWYHVMAFTDRSGSAMVYLNGVAGTADASSTASMTSTANTFIIGKTSATPYPFKGEIAYCAMWKQSDWLDTHLQADIAKERFAKLTGIYPAIATGTAIPEVATRASVAYVDKQVNGDNSADITTWVPQTGDSFTATGGTSPTGNPVYKLTSSVTSTVHLARQNTVIASGFTASSLYFASVELKGLTDEGKDIRLSLYGTGESHNWASFDLEAETATHAGLGNEVYQNIESLGDGWYLLSMACVLDTSENKNLFIYTNYSSTYAGGNDEFWMANPQVYAISRQLFPVGSNWMRVVKRSDSNGEAITGYLSEAASTNLIPYSQDFDDGGTSWINTRSTVTNDSVTAPDGTQTADTLVEDGTAASTHLVYDFFGSSAGTFTYSVWLKAANRSWAGLLFSSTTDGVSSAYFDLSTGTVGTTSALDDSGIEDWGNGWFRCWIKDTRATAELQRAFIYIAEADNDITFDGATQDSIYVWGAQVEETDYPSSYIATAGASATRNADVLYYKGDDGNITNNQQGTMEAKVLIPDADYPGVPSFLGLSDGGASVDRVLMYASATSSKVLTRSDSESDGSVSGDDIIDGTIHTQRVTYLADSLMMYLDDVETGSEDTDVGIPNDLDRIHIGTSNAGGTQPNGVVSNIKIYDEPLAP